MVELVWGTVTKERIDNGTDNSFDRLLHYPTSPHLSGCTNHFSISSKDVQKKLCYLWKSTENILSWQTSMEAIQDPWNCITKFVSVTPTATTGFS